MWTLSIPVWPGTQYLFSMYYIGGRPIWPGTQYLLRLYISCPIRFCAQYFISLYRKLIFSSFLSRLTSFIKFVLLVHIFRPIPTRCTLFIKCVLQVNTFRPRLTRRTMFITYVLQVDTFRLVLTRQHVARGGHFFPLLTRRTIFIKYVSQVDYFFMLEQVHIVYSICITGGYRLAVTVPSDPVHPGAQCLLNM